MLRDVSPADSVRDAHEPSKWRMRWRAAIHQVAGTAQLAAISRKPVAELCCILSGITATQTSRDVATARAARSHYRPQISVKIRS
jgi:hypothetical protein